MGFSYYFTFSAQKNIPADRLELFIRSVEKKAKKLGLNPTAVINLTYSSDEQKKLARRTTSGILVNDPRLRGVTLLDDSIVWHYDREIGQCRVVPERGVLLVVTNEQGHESVFGFLWYPERLFDLNGKELAVVPNGGRWFFHDFVDSPDKRYRAIVKMFAEAGYLDSESDEFG